MHEINTESIGFYAAVWAIAFLACLCRSTRDVSGVNTWNIISSCGMKAADVQAAPTEKES